MGFSPATGVIVAYEPVGSFINKNRRATKPLHGLGGLGLRVVVEKVGQDQPLRRVGEDGSGYAP